MKDTRRQGFFSVSRVLFSAFLAAVAAGAAWRWPARVPCWRVHVVDWAFRQRALQDLHMREVEDVQDLASREKISFDAARDRFMATARTPEQKRLAALPLPDFIAASAGGRLEHVSGAEWQRFFQTAEDALRRQTLPPEWSCALAPEDIRTGTFFSIFLPEDQPPLAGLGANARDGRPFYLHLDSADARYVEIEWIAPGRDEGTEIGPYDWPKKWHVPPAYRLPLQKHAAWLALLAAALPFLPALAGRAGALTRLPRLDAPSAIPEVLRRAGFFTLVGLALLLVCWTRLSPYWTVARVESREARNRVWADMAAPLIASTMPGAITNRAQAREVAAGLLAGRAEEPTRYIEVSGPEWESFLSAVAAVLRDGTLPAGWEKRVDDYTRRDLKRSRHSDIKINRLAFLKGEPPLAALAASVQFNQEYRLRLDGRDDTAVALHLMPAPEVSGFGGTHFSLPSPMVFPFRSSCPWLVAAAFVLYLLPRWRRIGPDTVAWPTWRLVLGDFASALLFLPFFGLPILIIGSTQHALTAYLPFTAIFWILAALGAYLILWCIRYACWSLELLPEGFRLQTISTSREIRYEDIVSIQRADLRPPKWLVVLSYIAIFVPSKGSTRMGQAGRAMILSSSSTGGLILRLRSGPSPILWVTDQMGTTAVRNFDKFTAELERHNIPRIEEVAEFRRITPPDFLEPAPGD